VENPHVKKMCAANFNLDRELWTAFRIACLYRHISASKVISLLMKHQIEEWEKEERTCATGRKEV
jgi:hypothetical protein